MTTLWVVILGKVLVVVVVVVVIVVVIGFAQSFLCQLLVLRTKSGV